ncbi:MAG: hypothetical protein J5879_06165 [Clostridia bacterium]|nr:hypothetical protein [Clostridia bacterium]
MDVLHSAPGRQLILALYSVSIGFIFGMIYSVIRMPVSFIRYCIDVNGKKTWPLFMTDLLLDILLFTLYTVTTVIFIYAANEGAARYYMIAFSLAGFIIQRLTVGRLFGFVSSKLDPVFYRIIRRIAHAIKTAIRPLYELICNYKMKKYIIKAIKNRGA